MDTVTADKGHNFIHPAQLATLEEVIRAIDQGKQIIYYSGESLGIAKTKSQKIANLSGQVWKFVVEGRRGSIHLRKIEGREDGLNRYEYLAVPSKKVNRC